MKFVKRIVIYLAGLFFVALGVAFSVNSNLGVSPVNSLPYVVSRILGKDLPDPAFKKGFPPSGSCPDPLLLCLWIFR